METKIQALGFSGFYQGIWDISENEHVKIHDHFSSEYGLNHLQLKDEWSFGPEYKDDVISMYAEGYIEMVNRILETNIKYVGRHLWQPRDYNYGNDEIYCHVEIEDYDALIKYLIELANDERYRSYIIEAIKRNHTSYPGFMSFMSNEFDEWCNIELLDSDNNHYLAYFIAYLVQAISPGSLQGFNEFVYYEACEAGLHIVKPESEDAKEEWKLYSKYGTLYTDWAAEHPMRYENTEHSWPKHIVLDWDEYKERFMDYVQEYEAEQKRLEYLRNQPIIPGLFDE